MQNGLEKKVIKNKPITVNKSIDIFNTKSILDNQNISIPDKIRTIYQNNYDIISLDKIIRLKIQNDKKVMLPQLQYQLNILNQKIQKPQFRNDRINTLNEINIIENKIENINNNKILDEYNNKVGSLLLYYKEHKNTIKKFSLDTAPKNVDEKSDTHLDDIINTYINIAKNYIDIIVVKKEIKEFEMCENCNCNIESIIASEKGIKICSECNCENVILLANSVNDDIPTKMYNKNKGLEDFMHSFDCYAGEKLVGISLDTLILALNKHFSFNNDDIKSLPLNRNRRRGHTTPRMLWDALKTTGYSAYYKYYTYIAHIYWNWELPDIEKYRNQVISIYIDTQKAYELIPDEEKERKSNLGLQYRLFKTLELVGHECWADEFRLPENSKSLTIANNLWKKMCDNSGNDKIIFQK